MSLSKSMLVNPFVGDNSCFIPPFWRQHLKDSRDRCSRSHRGVPVQAHYRPRHILTTHQWNLYQWVRRGHLINTCCWMSQQKNCNIHAVWITRGEKIEKQTCRTTVPHPSSFHTHTSYCGSQKNSMLLMKSRPARP